MSLLLHRLAVITASVAPSIAVRQEEEHQDGEREHRPAPETGQDTDAILAELGYDESERDRLYDSKAAWRGE